MSLSACNVLVIVIYIICSLYECYYIIYIICSLYIFERVLDTIDFCIVRLCLRYFLHISFVFFYFVGVYMGKEREREL